jgi:hypothetical protein
MSLPYQIYGVAPSLREVTYTTGTYKPDGVGIGILASSDGDVVFTSGGTEVTITLTSGSSLPCSVDSINETGTTVTDLFCYVII